MRWRSRSAADTRAAGAALAAALRPVGGVLVLDGPLGAGKTVFAKGLGQGLGLDPDRIASPTFVIAAEYPSPDGLRLVHVDAYRIETAAELEAAGLLDWLVDGVVVVVEWGQRVAGALPADRLEVRIVPIHAEPGSPGPGDPARDPDDRAPDPGDADLRELSLDALGPRAAEALTRFGEAWGPRGGLGGGARDTAGRRET